MTAQNIDGRNMAARNFALISGIAFLVIGISGFIPGLVSMPMTQPDPPLMVDAGYGYLMGLFPVNILHNVVHLTVGGLGLVTARSYKGALVYSQGLAIFYSVLAVMGLLPVLSTTLGLIPIFGNDVLLHLATAAIAGYFGFVAVPNVNEAVQEDQRSKAAS